MGTSGLFSAISAIIYVHTNTNTNKLRIQMYTQSKIQNLCFFSLQISILLRQHFAVLYMQVHACTRYFGWFICFSCKFDACNLWWNVAVFLNMQFLSCTPKNDNNTIQWFNGHHYTVHLCWISWKCHSLEHCSIAKYYKVFAIF